MVVGTRNASKAPSTPAPVPKNTEAGPSGTFAAIAPAETTIDEGASQSPANTTVTPAAVIPSTSVQQPASDQLPQVIQLPRSIAVSLNDLMCDQQTMEMDIDKPVDLFAQMRIPVQIKKDIATLIALKQAAFILKLKELLSTLPVVEHETLRLQFNEPLGQFKNELTRAQMDLEIAQNALQGVCPPAPFPAAPVLHVHISNVAPVIGENFATTR
ncbi:hypothetical protein EMPS_02795 [Entomortierella parvispora]|uniref:Uncharacterized protein n=1 Tax=Entomortierella parvispora TaxID=205924 RepID=A0A9P3H5D7_9FUNG|nr:hypothetical protein EMPS_02795 [Entomortierella parvispora]